MSQIIVAAVINMLVIVLPMLGVTVGNDQVTTTVQTIVIIFNSIWIYARRVQMGGVTLAGVRK